MIKRRGNWSVLLAGLWACLLQPQTLHAAAPAAEVFFHYGPLSPHTLALWASDPAPRQFLLELDSPARLTGAERLDLESSRYPREQDQAFWAELARKGASFVSLGAGVPSDDEAARLNALTFRRIVIVLTQAPSAEETARLARLKGAVSLVLAVPSPLSPEERERVEGLAIPVTWVGVYSGPRPQVDRRPGLGRTGRAVARWLSEKE